MAVIAVTTVKSRRTRDGKQGIRVYGTGGAASSDTLSTPAVVEGHRQRISYASVIYSGSPTQTGVTFTINSGAGAGYDTPLPAGAANALTTLFIPDSDLFLMEGDVLDVLAPTGGGALTAAITVVLEDE